LLRINRTIALKVVSGISLHPEILDLIGATGIDIQEFDKLAMKL
jgi:hypothetical protein